MKTVKTLTVQIPRPGAASLTLNYVEYLRTDDKGVDKVLQLKNFSREISPITMHPDGSINLHPAEESRDAVDFLAFISLGFPGVASMPAEVSQFIDRLRALRPQWLMRPQ